MKMPNCLTCCPETPWLAARRCRRPGPHCWRSLHSTSLSPEPRCRPSASHFLQCEAGNYGAKKNAALCEICLAAIYVVVQVSVGEFPPDGKDSAQIIHDIVELHLQIFQDITGLHTQLNQKHKCTSTTFIIETVLSDHLLKCYFCFIR